MLEVTLRIFFPTQLDFLSNVIIIWRIWLFSRLKQTVKKSFDMKKKAIDFSFIDQKKWRERHEEEDKNDSQ